MCEPLPENHSMIESERRWDELFSRSQDLLEKLANEAMAEYEAGLTEQLDPDELCS
jgi:hypothetical protein